MLDCVGYGLLMSVADLPQGYFLDNTRLFRDNGFLAMLLSLNGAVLESIRPSNRAVDDTALK